MKKLLTIMLCVATLSACGTKNPSVTPTSSPSTPTSKPSTVKTMITNSDIAEIPNDWTVLGEVGVIIDGEYTDIILATDAKRDKDGFINTEAAQDWRLIASNESKEYDLFSSNMNGTAYIEVVMEGNSPVINLVTTGASGMAVSKYTYADGAFYSEAIIEPSTDGNKIYSSFPEYYE